MSKYMRYGFLGFLALVFLLLFIPFYSEILLAAVFAFALDPLTRRLSTSSFLKKYSLFSRRKQWVAFTLFILFLAVLLPIILAISNVYQSLDQMAANGLQNTDFYKDLLNLRSVSVNYIEEILNSFNIAKPDLSVLSERLLKELGQLAMAFSGNFVSRIPNFIAYIFVFCCALYYFLAESRQIGNLLLSRKILEQKSLDQIIIILQKASSSVLFASVVTGLVQAFIVAIGSAFFGVGDFFIVLVITFFLSFIPVIGAAPVAILLGLITLINHNFTASIGFLVISIIAGSIDNLLRPILVGGEEDIHPIIILLAVIGAISLFGFPGLFLGPVIATVTVKAFRVL